MLLKNLWQRRNRTLLTTLGIAVGVAAVVIFSAFGEGLANGFEQLSSSAGADLTIAQKDAVITIMSAVDDTIGADLARIPGVTQVTGTVVGIVQMSESPYFFAMGEQPRGFSIRHYHLIAGQQLTGKRQILLGKLAARNFKKTVGDRFRLGSTSYQVVGIYETGVGLEDGGAVITLADAQRAFDKRHQVSYFNLKVRDPHQIDALKHEIERRWPELSATRSGEQTQQTQMLGMYRAMGWFLGIFAVLVGGLGMMNTTMMSVFERTREIGVLRAVGWRRRRVVGMIMGESLILALAGGLLGCAIGMGLMALASSVPAVAPLLQGRLSPTLLVQALVVALLLGAAGGAYPAWRAARLAPVEAMRRESGVGVQLGRSRARLARLFGGSAARNLLRRPARTLMTMTGLGIGVGFIVALQAITEGAVASFSAIAGADQADLIAEQANVSDAMLSSIDERIADQIRLRPEVASVSKLVFGTSSAPGLPFFLVYGVDPGETYIQHYHLRAGRAIARPREMMIGRFAADSLKKQLGDSMRVGGSSYQIVGIFENGVSYEDTGGVVALEEAQRTFHKTRQLSFIAIALKDPATADEVVQALEYAFPSIIVSKAANFTDRMQDFATMEALFQTLTILMIVVGGIVMTNVMMMSVFERTQEIGVLRALGWKRRRVVQMVLVESLALSLLSAIAGSLLGVGLSYLLTLTPVYGQFLPPAFSSATFIQALLLTMLLGTLGSLYPAWRASGMRPVDALRYE